MSGILETPTASSSARWLWDGEGSSLLMGLQPLPKRSRVALGTWTFSNRLPEGPYRFQSWSESSSLVKVWGANRQTAAWCPRLQRRLGSLCTFACSLPVSHAESVDKSGPIGGFGRVDRLRTAGNRSISHVDLG